MLFITVIFLFWQEIVIDNFDSKTNHLAQKCFLPAFKKIFVEGKQKSSNENLNQIIHVFFKNKSIIPLSQITTTPAFPKPCVLFHLNFKVYKDHKER